MYNILYATIFFSLIFYFGTAIKEAILYFSNFNNKYLSIGNPWFFSLLIINIILLIFIYNFYKVKSGKKSIGLIGFQGYPGIKGQKGEPCIYC